MHCRTTRYSCGAAAKKPNLGHSFISLVLRAPVGEVAPPQLNPNLFVDVCNIYCSGLEKIGKHWEDMAFLQVH